MNLTDGTNGGTTMNEIIHAPYGTGNGTNSLRDEQTTAPACLNHSGPGGGALPARHAPPASTKGTDVTLNRFPRGRWAGTVASMRTPPPLDGLVEAPLRELFWSPPQTSMLEEATERIGNLLTAAANAVQEVQLFDDLYEIPAC